MQISVLGAGAWGTAVAVSLAARHSTLLWARDANQVDRMAATGVNADYLPGVALPDSLLLTADFDAAVAHGRGTLVILATPMAALESMLLRLAGRVEAVLWLCKGFEPRGGRLGHEVARAVAPGLRVGVVSGPSFAIEVARGQPTALVAASADAGLCDLAVEALHSESLRVYTSDDPIGVEVGGAVKNVLAIATGIADGLQVPATGIADGLQLPSTGIADGLQVRSTGVADARSPLGLGLNARAALVTRGLAEMTRLGVALGARGETFMGLSGLGDLVLTATGDLSRNRRVGQALARGLPLARILAELGHVAEGVATAPMVLTRARALGVEMPITEAVVQVLDARLAPADALERLMGREARPERRQPPPP